MLSACKERVSAVEMYAQVKYYEKNTEYRSNPRAFEKQQSI